MVGCIERVRYIVRTQRGKPIFVGAVEVVCIERVCYTVLMQRGKGIFLGGERRFVFRVVGAVQGSLSVSYLLIAVRGRACSSRRDDRE